MTTLRTLTPTFSAAPQIDPAMLAGLAAEGFVAVICNRPDGEDAGQPEAQEVAAAAEAAGMSFTHIPVSGGVGPGQVEAMGAALAAAGGGRVLAYCRSGTRSTNLWALAQAAAGEDPEALVAAAAGGGYDLSGLRPMLMQLAGR